MIGIKISDNMKEVIVLYIKLEKTKVETISTPRTSIKDKLIRV